MTKNKHPHKQVLKVCSCLLLATLALCVPVAAAAATGQQELVARAEGTLEKIDGLDEEALAALCKHYGFSYSHGECQSAKGSVPVDKLVEVASYHYPELGEVLGKRRDEVAKLEKQCGKKAGRLKTKLAAFDKKESKLQALAEAPEARLKKQKSKLDKAAKELADIEQSLRKVEQMDATINKAVSKILQGTARTDVSIIKGKSGCRLSANISKTISPDAVIRAQQYVWATSATENDDEGIDL